MISMIFAVSLIGALKDMQDSDMKLAKVCYANGIARGRLLELSKEFAERGQFLDPRVSMILAEPVPAGCDGKIP